MKRKFNDSGMVSLVVCMIIMIIIALITISFATLARREQRQALDSELSKQAFYAAETGVNDALNAIYNPDPAHALTTNITTCSDADQDLINTTRTLDGDIGYTCVFVDQTPPQIVATVKQERSSVFRISAVGLSKLTFTWQNDDTSAAQVYPSSTVTSPDFPIYNNWDGTKTPGILRIELIPVVASRAASANTIDVFGYPTTDTTGRSSHAAIADAAKNGEVLTGKCIILTNKCSVSIDLDGAAGGADYYLRMISLYDATSVVVEGFDGSGSTVKFIGAQAAIDSTGKSGDVLRRIKVYKALLGDRSAIPDYTLGIGDDLCKRLATNSYGTTADGAAIPLCDPSGL